MSFLQRIRANREGQVVRALFGEVKALFTLWADPSRRLRCQHAFYTVWHKCHTLEHRMNRNFSLQMIITFVKHCSLPLPCLLVYFTIFTLYFIYFYYLLVIFNVTCNRMVQSYLILMLRSRYWSFFRLSIMCRYRNSRTNLASGFTTGWSYCNTRLPAAAVWWSFNLKGNPIRLITWSDHLWGYLK